MARWTLQRLQTGIDEQQARARRHAGLSTRVSGPRVSPHLVSGIVSNDCPDCGTSNPYPVGSKRPNLCAGCGHPIVYKKLWDASGNFWTGGGV